MSVNILKRNHLSITHGRLGLLNVLMEAAYPLSEKEIEERIKTGCNRTTIYRNLNTLVGKGVIYRIIADGVVKYKYSGRNGAEHDALEHVHFKCEICTKVVCLHEMPVQPYSLPEGFTGKETQFLILGVCNDCNGKNGS